MKKLLFLTVPLIMVGAMALTNKGTDANYAEFDITRPIQPSHINTSGLKDHISDFASISFSKPDFSGSIYRPLKKYTNEDVPEEGSLSGKYSQFTDIADCTSYLGFGYNVFESRYVNKYDVLKGNPIFDMNKLQNANLLLDREKSFFSTYFEGSSMQDFSQSYNASLSVDVTYGPYFSGGLEADYKGSTSSQTFYYFYKGLILMKSFSLTISENDNALRGMLDSDFASDLNDSNVSPSQLFDKYGTHFLKDVVMGARLELNSTYYSQTTSYSNEVNAAIQAEVNYMNLCVKGRVTGGYSNQYEEKNIKKSENVFYVGGDFYNMIGAEGVNTNVTDWIESFNYDISKSSLIDVPNYQSLVPLWNLVDSSNQARKDELRNYFINAAAADRDSLYDKFKIREVVKVNAISAGNGSVTGSGTYDKGTYVTVKATPNKKYGFDGWYKNGIRVSTNKSYSFYAEQDVNLQAKFFLAMHLGGNGTYNDPFIIKTADDFEEIQYYMDGYYKLNNNVDFKKNEINPIVGEFNGTFDGNGKKITNYRITRYYNGGNWVNLGLFESLGAYGYIHNLIMNDCYITVTCGTRDSVLVYAGVLCGTNMGGTIDNVDFSGDKVKVESKFSLIGIVTGYSKGIIRNCDLKTIEVRGRDVVGGVTGTSDTESSKILNCTIGKYWNSAKNIIELDAGDNNTGTYRAGGFCGYGFRTTIQNCTIKDTNFFLKGSAANNPAIGIYMGYMYYGTVSYKNTGSGITKKNEIPSYTKYFFAANDGLFGHRDGGTVTKV